MPTTFGDTTKSIFLNGPESHKLALQFEAAPNLGKITFDGDLGASNVFAATIQGHVVTAEYASSHANTMGLIVAALKANTHVQDAKIAPSDARSIYFYLKDASEALSIVGAAVTGGSARVVTTAEVDNTIYPGSPVGLFGDGELVGTMEFMTAWWGATEAYHYVGVSIHTAAPGELLTAFVKGFTVIYAEADGAMVSGPVKNTGYNATTAYNKFAVTAVNTDRVGWALDNVATTELCRVLLG